MCKALHILTATAIVMALTALASCRSCPQCPEVSESSSMADFRSDDTRAYTFRLDSVTVRDSVVMTISGDTVRIRETRWRERVSVRTDTLTITRFRIITRNLTRTVTLTRTVETPRPWWLKTLAAAGAAAMIAALCIIGRRLKIFH